MKRSIWSLFIGLLALQNLNAQDKNGVPETVMEHWKLMSSGIWIAENKYKSEDLPIDAYGMNWEIAPGAMAFVGTLFTIQEGKENQVLWHFLNYWDPGQQKVVTVQYGNNPGLGNIAIGHNPPDKSSTESESSSKIYDGNGKYVGSIGHINQITDNELQSNSFNIVDGKWEKRGEFTWRLTKK